MIPRYTDLEDRFRARPEGFTLAEHETDDTAGLDKDEQAAIREAVARLRDE